MVFGARQCGKSTLVENLLANKDYLYFNGDDAHAREVLSITTVAKLMLLVGDKKIVFINKTQSIKNIGTTLK